MKAVAFVFHSTWRILHQVIFAMFYLIHPATHDISCHFFCERLRPRLHYAITQGKHMTIPRSSFSWRRSVDGRPNLTNTATFSNSSGVVWVGPKCKSVEGFWVTWLCLMCSVWWYAIGPPSAGRYCCCEYSQCLRWSEPLGWNRQEESQTVSC